MEKSEKILVNNMNQNTQTYRNRLSYHATVLGGMALLAGTVLVLGEISTLEIIAERLAEDMRASLQQVIPAQRFDNDILQDVVSVTNDAGEPVDVYIGTHSGRISALAFQVSSQGYAGDINIMIGLDASGNILGVRVISHSETPGLGDKIELDKSDWVLSFNGLSLDNTPQEQWGVKKDNGRFDQFTGATITPRTVVREIHEGLEFFNHHKNDILSQYNLENSP